MSNVGDGVVGQGPLARSVDGTNFTICEFNPNNDQITGAFLATDLAEFNSLGYMAAFRRQINVSDFCYAGADSSGNHVWYALCYLVNTTGIVGPLGTSYINKPFLAKSTDNAATFTTLNFDETKTDNSEYFTSVGNVTRIYASIEKDYLFIFKTAPTSILYRYFPSQDNNTSNDNCVIKPIVAGNSGTLTQNQTGVSTIETYYLKQVTVKNQSQIPLLILDNGLCIMPGEGEYAISWNYGINWAVADLPSITNTH